MVKNDTIYRPLTACPPRPTYLTEDYVRVHDFQLLPRWARDVVGPISLVDPNILVLRRCLDGEYSLYVARWTPSTVFDDVQNIHLSSYNNGQKYSSGSVSGHIAVGPHSVAWPYSHDEGARTPAFQTWLFDSGNFAYGFFYNVLHRPRRRYLWHVWQNTALLRRHNRLECDTVLSRYIPNADEDLVFYPSSVVGIKKFIMGRREGKIGKHVRLAPPAVTGSGEKTSKAVMACVALGFKEEFYHI